MLGRKQNLSDADWRAALATLRRKPDKEAVERKTAAAVARIHQAGGRLAYAWSGGKDSLVLERVCALAGVTAGVYACSSGLEYPAFSAWVAGHKPAGVRTERAALDMAWLAAHSALLFPQDGGTAHRWDELIHLQAQRAYYVAEGLDGLLLGRRLADGNYCGTQGRYTTRSGLTYLSPLYDWTHEEVLTFLEMHEVELPPIYEWRHGWTCGTHPWAGRQHTGSVMNGWREVYEIDRGIVRAAAAWIASAQDFLRRLG